MARALDLLAVAALVMTLAMVAGCASPPPSAAPQAAPIPSATPAPEPPSTPPSQPTAAAAQPLVIQPPSRPPTPENTRNKPSEATRFLPTTLDPLGDYYTYSQSELYAETVDLAGKTDRFVGKKIKVLARYDGLMGNWINRTRITIIPKDWGCHLQICDSMERLLPHKGDLRAAYQGLSLPLKNFTLAAYFSTPEKYKRFRSSADSLCTLSYPCYVWVVGQLKYADGDFKTYGVQRKLRLVYIDVDDLLMLEGNDNQFLESAIAGIKGAASVASTVSKFTSVLSIFSR